MIRQFKPLPPDLVLASTLAQRVSQLREFRNLTVRDLSKLSRFTIQRVEDIEAGLETWLSSTDRQLLAKALAVEPYILQDVERKSGLEPTEQQMRVRAQLTQSILNGGQNLECPNCSGTLKCTIDEGLNVFGESYRFAKAFCLKCPFLLKPTP